jgi:hypothetical protein
LAEDVAVEERLPLRADLGLGFAADLAVEDAGEKTLLAPSTAPLVLATINPTVVPTFSAIEFSTGFPFGGLAMVALSPNRSHGILPLWQQRLERYGSWIGELQTRSRGNLASA